MGSRIVAFLKKYHLSVDRKIPGYLVCVAIATVLWFLNALNKEYIGTVSYPVEYIDLPAGKFLTSRPPERLDFEVSTKGYTLLRYWISSPFRPIVLDINTLSNQTLEKQDVWEYTLKLNDIREKINQRMENNIRLLGIHPEEILFVFSPAVAREVAVRPDIDYSLEKQGILKNKIETVPDVVVVNGPRSIIDTIRYISTASWNAGVITKKAEKKLRLLPVPGITLETGEVTVTLEAERATEARKTVPVEILNLPKHLQIKLFPASVEISYEVGLSRYDKITEQDFRFAADYNRRDGSAYLPVTPASVPELIRNLSFQPHRVEYILETRTQATTGTGDAHY